MRRTFSLLLVLLLGGLAGCSAIQDLMPKRPTVAFLIADDSAHRWTHSDEPKFQAALRQVCPECKYVTEVADGDAKTQAEQFADQVAAEVDVIVLNPVDVIAAQELTDSTKIPVLAYDQFVVGSDYFLGFDPREIGVALGNELVKRVPKQGKVLVINGPKGDPSAVQIEKGVSDTLGPAKLKVLATYSPPEWDETLAKEWTTQQLKKLPPASIDGVLTSSDAQAEGAVNALKAAGVSGKDWPVVTGQDADLPAVHRLMFGTQASTVYKSYREQAERAATIATALAKGDEVSPKSKFAVDFEGVPSELLPAKAVSLTNLTDVVIRDGLYTLADLCPVALLDRCRQLGLI